MLAPVPVTVTIFAFPDTEILTLLLASTLTSELPLTINEPVLTEIFVSRLPSPEKKFAVARLPRLALPDEILPVTDNDESVPTLVIFGCEFVVTVPAVVALVADATAPVTFAP